MRELIAKCPNIIPAGLGNNMSEMGVLEYLPGGLESDFNFTSFDINAAQKIRVRLKSKAGVQHQAATNWIVPLATTRQSHQRRN
jgi:hypothetical protein